MSVWEPPRKREERLAKNPRGRGHKRQMAFLGLVLLSLPVVTAADSAPLHLLTGVTATDTAPSHLLRRIAFLESALETSQHKLAETREALEKCLGGGEAQDIPRLSERRLAATSSQYTALSALYSSTNGPFWTNKTNWMNGDPCEAPSRGANSPP